MRARGLLKFSFKGPYGGNLAGMPHYRPARGRRAFARKGRRKLTYLGFTGDLPLLLLLAAGIGLISMALINGELVRVPTLMTAIWFGVVFASISVLWFFGLFVARRRYLRRRRQRERSAPASSQPRGEDS